MKLKSIELENIRSYSHEKIDIPEGIILFEGDIGSGKSTILYAVEFALFGLGDLKAGYLLRHGTNKGSVNLVIEVDDKNYEIKRTIERKGNAVKHSGSIIYDERKREFTPDEMKPFILKLLGFNENPSTRSTSVIYRYAVFTPQEEMKEILKLRDEDRLQTLRKAFGMEEYKTAKENAAKLLLPKIKENEEFLSGLIDDLDEKINSKKKETENHNALKKEEDKLIPRIDKLKKELEGMEKNLELLRNKKEIVDKLEAETPQLHKSCNDKKSRLQRLENQKNDDERSIRDGNKDMQQIKKYIRPTKKSESELAKEISNKEKSIRDLDKELGGLNKELSNYRFLIKNKECPTCKQKIDMREFETTINHFDSEKGKKEEMLKIYEKDLDKLRELKESLNKYLEVQEKIEDKRKYIIERVTSLNKCEDEINQLKSEIIDLERNITLNKVKLEENKQVKSRIDSEMILEKEKRNELLKTERYLKECETRIEEILVRIERLNAEISEKEKHKQEKDRMYELRIWFEDYLVPTLEIIEQHILAHLNEQFNLIFQKWFNMLIDSSDIDVRVNENFRPDIKQEGYDADIESLSGGEKTSVALAYRLALNILVRNECCLKKSNLLILDEPTDGFSKEQLFRVRDVLNELRSEQVILVSHERELENFADKVYRITKTNNRSKVEA